MKPDLRHYKSFLEGFASCTQPINFTKPRNTFSFALKDAHECLCGYPRVTSGLRTVFDQLTRTRILTWKQQSIGNEQLLPQPNQQRVPQNLCKREDKRKDISVVFQFHIKQILQKKCDAPESIPCRKFYAPLLREELNILSKFWICNDINVFAPSLFYVQVSQP